MTQEIKRRRGTTAQHATFTGAEGELTFDTDKKVVVGHDGVTAGGFPHARADQVEGLVSGRVRFDEEQSLTPEEGAQARSNIGVGVAGHIYGLILSNSASDATNDIVVAPGECTSDADIPAFMVLGTAITKRLDAAWAGGDGNGGLDTGSKTASKWYHVWLIKNLTTGAVDALFSLSATNPTMPSGWAAKRRIGAIGTDASNVIRPFWQHGDYFGLATPTQQIESGTPVNNGAVIWDIDCPLGVKLRLNLICIFASPTGVCYLAIKDPDEGVATLADADAVSGGAGAREGALKTVGCNASGQVYVYGGLVTDVTLYGFYFKGWQDMRGRLVNDSL